MVATFEPTRSAGLARLAGFVPRSGRAYAAERNHDRGPDGHTSVSRLSPYLRHRLVLEREVIAAVTERYALSTADKFVSEVYWRTYFKGFLERRPTIWSHYRARLAAHREAVARDGALARDLAAAEAGETGIDAFDHWARELDDTAYLHNHARMWFASIWIFTLRLPWELGADLFLRRLVDGDPASNTLSWRWVAGLHTKGRTYLARADNIARYTEGRVRATGLATAAPPLTEEVDHPLRPVPDPPPVPDGAVLWLITEEDCASEDLAAGANVAGALATVSAADRSHGEVAPTVLAFTRGAVADAAARCGAPSPVPLDGDALVAAAREARTDVIAFSYAPVGPVADRLAAARPGLSSAGVRLVPVLRPEDPPAWQQSDRGFFKLRKAIPRLVAA